MKHKVPVQSLIDHIKTAVDVDPWAKEMAEELLKEQDELLRKKQKDIDRLCNEISEWKHKYHDKSLKEQEAVEPKECDIPGIFECGACGSSVMREIGYRFRNCPWCGKRIEWE